MQDDEQSNPRCPRVSFSKDEIRSFYKPWSKALVVRVLERNFSFITIKRRLESLWAKSGSIQVTDAPNAFFLVRFSDQDDYKRAAFGGPWKISVTRIGNHIGRTARLDMATSEGARSRYARVCVEVDISKLLLGKYMIYNRVFYVEYESLENISFTCGFYGHKLDSYLSNETADVACKESGPVASPEPEVTVTSCPEGGAGCWMTIQRRSKGRKDGPATTTKHSKPSGSRFDILRHDVDTQTIPASTEKPEAHQTNVEADFIAHAAKLAEILRQADSPNANKTLALSENAKDGSPREPISDVTNHGKSKKPKALEVTKRVSKGTTDDVMLVSVPVTYSNPIIQESVKANSAGKIMKGGPSGVNQSRLRSNLPRMRNAQRRRESRSGLSQPIQNRRLLIQMKERSLPTLQIGFEFIALSHLSHPLMIIMSWNCRGAGHAEFVPTLKFYMSKFKSLVVFILEPRISGAAAAKVLRKLDFDSRIIIEAHGFSGGIWVLWNSFSATLMEEARSEQVIHMKVSIPGHPDSVASAVYIRPNPTRRAMLWDELHHRTLGESHPWALFGDFNVILLADEKDGGAPFVPYRSASFKQCVDTCGLQDSGFIGPRFTWFRGSLRERLDRGLANMTWRCAFPEAVVKHLPQLRSDHRPILACFFGLEIPNRSRRPFRFIVPWLSHPDFPRLLSSVWRTDFRALTNLIRLSAKLRSWNRDVYGNISRRKDALLMHLAEIEHAMVSNPTAELCSAEANTRKNLEHTLWEEAVLWAQKSRANWINDDDRNTRYFHQSTLKRRASYKISVLQLEDGTWIDDPTSLQNLAIGHFSKLFREEDGAYRRIINGFFPLSASEAEQIMRAPDMSEIRSVVSSMKGLKAPGADGFQPIFFQRQWDFVGTAVTKFVRNCFQDNSAVAGINDTIIVLIPKVSNPETMHQFPPLAYAMFYTRLLLHAWLRGCDL
ncbi:Transposon TX1 uncharacterized 149 kDa protein [Linum perenne]